MKKVFSKYSLIIITIFVLFYILIDGFNIYSLNKKEIPKAGMEYIKAEDKNYKLDKQISKDDSNILIFNNGDRYELLHFKKSFFIDRYKLMKDDTIDFSKDEEVNDIIENSFYDYLLRIDFKDGDYDLSLKKVKNDNFRDFILQSIFIVFIIFILDGIKKKR